jgi:hypothetical protein
MSCTTCGVKPAEAGHDECFRCRVSSVGFTWRGGGGTTRETFSTRTTTEWLNEHVGFDHADQIRSEQITRKDDRVWS